MLVLNEVEGLESAGVRCGWVVTRVLRAEIVGFHVDPIRSYYSVCDWGLNQNGWIGLLIKA